MPAPHTSFVFLVSFNSFSISVFYSFIIVWVTKWVGLCTGYVGIGLTGGYPGATLDLGNGVAKLVMAREQVFSSGVLLNKISSMSLPTKGCKTFAVQCLATVSGKQSLAVQTRHCKKL